MLFDAVTNLNYTALPVTAIFPKLDGVPSVLKEFSNARIRRTVELGTDKYGQKSAVGLKAFRHQRDVFLQKAVVVRKELLGWKYGCIAQV